MPVCLTRASIKFCDVEHVALHSIDSLDDGRQIGIIGYALKGLDNQFLRMSPRFTTRSNMPQTLGAPLRQLEMPQKCPYKE
jgi:hypothetical protein